jgi:hypothetical protein
MKKVFLFVLGIVMCALGISQPITQRSTSPVTVQDARLFAQFNFRPPVFIDTVDANANIGIDSCGALIFARSINAYYYRACSPKRWITITSQAINPWLLGGNNAPISTNLGTLDNKEITFITNGLARMRVAGTGINRSTTPRQKYLSIDTSNRYVYYTDGTDTASLSARINQRIDSLKRSGDSVFAQKNGQWIFQYKDSIGGGGSTPSLQQVTDVDSVTTNNIYVNQINYYDSVVAPQHTVKTKALDGGFYVYSNFSNSNMFYVDYTSGFATYNSDSGSVANFVNVNVNGIKNYYLPDTSGTLALKEYTIDSLKRNPGTDSVFAQKNGQWNFQYKDSVGAGSSAILHGTASGTDTYTVTIAGATAYADGDAYLVRFPNGNTTGATLNINGFGAVALYRNNDGPVIGGDIWNGAEMLCIYNSTTSGFQLIGTSPNAMYAYVTNAGAVTITKGQVVYAFGGQGDRMTVKLASNVSDSASAQTVGVVLSTSIAANQKGVIITQGLLDGLSILPTSTFSDGDPLFLGATSGSITKVKPSAPNHLVYLGNVTTASNGSAGRWYVRVQNGYELQELHNVAISSPTNNQVLAYSDTQSLWKNRNIYSIVDTSIFQRKSVAAFTFKANNTASTANATDQVFRDSGTLTYSGTTGAINWTGTTPPSGTPSHRYRWCQIGKQVTITISLNYSSAGTALTAVKITLPAGCPNPTNFGTLTAANDILGSAWAFLGTSTTAATTGRVLLQNNAGNNGYEFNISSSSGNYRTAGFTLTYFTD